MKMSICTDYFFDYPAEDAVKMLAEDGWSNLELSTEHAEELIDRGNILKTARELRKLAEGLKTQIGQGHMLISCNITLPDQDKTIDLLKKWLDLFHELGIKSAVLHPGGWSLIKEGYEKDYVDEKRIYVLKPLAEYIHGSDMSICLENTTGTIPDIDGLNSLIDLIDSPHIGICLDTGHLNMKGGPQGDFIRKAGSRLKALHIHDNQGKEDQHILPFSCGNINWKEVIDALRDINYQHLFNFEIPLETNASVPVRMAKLEYVKKIYALMMDGKAFPQCITQNK